MTTIIDYTQSVLTNGGATWREDTSHAPESGYLVSIKSYEVRISADAFNPGELATYVNSTREYTSNDENLWYGAWLNPDNGLVYLDLSVHVQTRQEAELIADLEDQIAVYKLDTDEVITTR